MLRVCHGAAARLLTSAFGEIQLRLSSKIQHIVGSMMSVLGSDTNELHGVHINPGSGSANARHTMSWSWEEGSETPSALVS